MPETITIRATGVEDIAAVDALLARSYPVLLKPDYPPSVMVTAVPLICRAQPRLVTCGTYFVAEDARRRTLGAGGWTASERGRARADIRHVAVDPAEVRRGVGRALMEHVFRTAGAAGIRDFTCLSTYSAVPFYESMGFLAVGPMQVPLAPGIVFPALKMFRHG